MPALEFLHKDMALVLFKTEGANYGVDPVPVVGTDAVYVVNADVQASHSEIEIKRMRDTFAATGVAIGKCWYDVMVDLPLSGPPDPGALTDMVAPEAGVLLEAAGLDGTLTDAGSGNLDLYTMVRNSKDQQVTGTLYFYRFGNGGNCELIKALGCVLTWTCELPSGGEALWKLTGKAIYSVPTNVARPAAPTFLTPSDKVVDRGATISVGGRDDCIDNVTINSGGEVVDIPCKSAEYGIAGFTRILGNPSIDIDPKKVLTSTNDIDTEVVDSTLQAASFAVTSVRGALYTFSFPNVQRGAFTYDTGSNVIRTTGKLYPTDTDAGDGDDSLSITVKRAP